MAPWAMARSAGASAYRRPAATAPRASRPPRCATAPTRPAEGGTLPQFRDELVRVKLLHGELLLLASVPQQDFLIHLPVLLRHPAERLSDGVRRAVEGEAERQLLQRHRPVPLPEVLERSGHGRLGILLRRHEAARRGPDE